jgi:hypothetical protein
MSIFEVLQSTGLPVAYSHFRTAQEPPFIVYMGDGQQTLSADNTFYWTDNDYQVEYYFTKKNETNEAAIEAALLSAGYQYDKSEDVYIEDQDLFVIYYYI